MSRSERTVNTTYFELTVSNTSKTDDKDFHYFRSVPSMPRSEMIVNTKYFELTASKLSKNVKDFPYF